ncbi:probable Dol-P-Man:Man(7)GlcNAc(2)-PP-Dol alpha-1,6-mannosyltransferase isoform X2 [Paramacrobiotus metropolitanus]|uniref:probable Dol-P-Man:Man(7)GlcNAc(2)-PP-Dol alpha-1,6-mannosyltransferase isoform X2 n=1 Tax=Paramacrobiotus metropolitanus TaxID=2943436 RepID=UPI0024463D2C|nr:probable Dol-P-Man:Man(7)GlcNAc(2)-PP-Dol alpha-1,6-mannosyltransferase isoform X2 [Paramacrobiotus metropolitanus]
MMKSSETRKLAKPASKPKQKQHIQRTWLLPELIFMSAFGIHLAVCPWTKVEESFNTQAIHDILFHGFNISAYDHQEFPGPVPRTFIGAFSVASISLLPKFLLVDCLHFNKVAALAFARCSLGFLVICSFKVLLRIIRKHFGQDVALWTALITASQFHFLFYATRPLANIFALPLVILATAFWIDDQVTKTIRFGAFATVIFRSELCLLFGPMLLSSLLRKKISFMRGFVEGGKAVAASLLLTFLVDSYFWGRPVWPEGEVLWFNTVKNQSSNWGTSPFAWYFYSVIPRLSLASLPLSLYGTLKNRNILNLIAPFLLFVFSYSFLPHKELRFVIYIVPVFNLSAAVACARISSTNRFSSLLCKAHLLVNLLAAAMFLFISSWNYRGGDALYELHQIESSTKSVHLFLDNFSCQNGVSRFLHMNDKWIYNKTETVDLRFRRNLRPTNVFQESLLRFDTVVAILRKASI